MLLSVVIPCYNEAENLPHLIKNCKDLNIKNIEIILVNNGSNDDSLKIMQKLVRNLKNIKILNIEENKGYGHGIIKGLQLAKGDVLCWTHADLQTDLSDILIGYSFFEKNNNLFVKGKRVKRKFSDNIFTIGMSIFETILFRKFFWDINAQPNLFRRSFYETWKNPPNDFSLDLYVYYFAIRNKLKIKRFNVTFKNRLFGHSKWNLNWRSKIRFILRTIKFSINLVRNNLR